MIVWVNKKVFIRYCLVAVDAKYGQGKHGSAIARRPQGIAPTVWGFILIQFACRQGNHKGFLKTLESFKNANKNTDVYGESGSGIMVLARFTIATLRSGECRISWRENRLWTSSSQRDPAPVLLSQEGL